MKRLIVITAFMLAICSLNTFLPVASYAFEYHNGNYHSFGRHGKQYGFGNPRHYDYKYERHKSKYHDYDSYQFRHHNFRSYGFSHHIMPKAAAKVAPEGNF